MNNGMTDTCFCEIKNKKKWIFLLFAIAVGGLYALKQIALLRFLILGSVAIAIFYDPAMAMGLYIISADTVSNIFPSVIHIAIIAVVCCSFTAHGLRYARQCREFLVLACFCASIAISSMAGFNPNFNTGVILFFCVYYYMMIVNIRDKEKCAVIAWSYYCAAIGMVVYILFTALRGGEVIKYGRLSFGGDIKVVSEAMVYPLALILGQYISSEEIFHGFPKRKSNLVMGAVFGIVLILTLARGIMLALMIAFLIEFLYVTRKSATFVRILPVAIFAVGVILLSMDSGTFRIQRLFESDEFLNGNGRTDIWKYYIELIIDRGPLSVIFGIGPGSIARISNTGLYAHSTYLDFFFSYGLVGFIQIIVLQMRSIVGAIRTRKLPLIGLIITCFVLNITHGSAANVNLFIIQGLIMQRYYNEGHMNEDES